MSSDTSSQPLNYRGRRAFRAKSEARRRLILEAALRVIAKEGVRAIRHRAIAKEADVPLAATTYYFKDIDELIIDAFTLYTEKALAEVTRFSYEFEKPLTQMLNNNLHLAQGNLSTLMQTITEQLVQYIQNQADTYRTMLVIEQAFRYEAILNQRINELVKIHQQALTQHIERFFKMLNFANPKVDAGIVLALFNSLEYKQLLNNKPNDTNEISLIIARYLELLSLDLNRRSGAG